MILLISTCAQPLHEFEFVKPVADIVQKSGKEILISHYKNLVDEELNKAEKIIICGTSLKDNEFLKNINEFRWLKEFQKPVLGICAGAHIIGLIHGMQIQEEKQIGLKELNLETPFLGASGKLEVYHLHNLKVLPETFHKDNFYATLFHPEVRNKEMIEEFVNYEE